MPSFIVSFIFIFLFISQIFTTFASNNSLVDFNDTGDLTNKFTSDGTPQFTNTSSGGLNNTGAIFVPLGSNDIWTTKQSYSISGAGDVYTFSAYFKIEANSGWGGLGFTSNSANSCDFQCQPETGIGMSFHGGGGAFVNNRVYSNVSWPPDLVLGNWYKMILEVQNRGSSKFDLNFKIYNSDSSGELGSLKTEKTQSDVINTSLGEASTIYGFFAASGSRMSYIDDFYIELEGGSSIIEAGSPVVLTTSITNITSSTATGGGNVTNENGSPVTSRGVCVSTSPNPTTNDICTSDGSGSGAYTSLISGLSGNTTYYSRAYAINANGTSYGSELVFTTEAALEPEPEPEPIPDTDPIIDPTDTEADVENSINNSDNMPLKILKKAIKKFKSQGCVHPKPEELTWLVIKPSNRNGVNGVFVTWTQFRADRVSIFIDNGKGKFPWVIYKTLNDGNEFLPNVSLDQKIKIKAYNSCKTGNFSTSISGRNHPNGWWNINK